MRICYVLLSPTYGMHQYTADLANRMLDAGHDVRLVTTATAPRDRYSPRLDIALLSDLFGSISRLCHKITNPLTSIMGRAQMLQMRVATGSVDEKTAKLTALAGINLSGAPDSAKKTETEIHLSPVARAAEARRVDVEVGEHEPVPDLDGQLRQADLGHVEVGGPAHLGRAHQLPL